MTEFQRHALFGAAQASEATTELLRYATEGAAFATAPFSESDPVAQLADATAHAGRVAIQSWETLTAEERDTLGQLVTACERFLSDWRGQ